MLKILRLPNHLLSKTAFFHTNRFHPFKGWFAQPYKGPTLASASMTLAFALFKPSWYDYLPPLKGSSYSFLNNESSI